MEATLPYQGIFAKRGPKATMASAQISLKLIKRRKGPENIQNTKGFPAHFQAQVKAEFLIAYM